MVGVIIILVVIFLLHLAVKDHRKKEDAYIKYYKEYPNATRELMREYLSEGRHYEDCRKVIGGLSEGELISKEDVLIDKEFSEKVVSSPVRRFFYERYIFEAASVILKKTTTYDFEKRLSITREFLYNSTKCKRFTLENLYDFDIFIEKKIDELYHSLKDLYPEALKQYEMEHSKYTKFQIVAHDYEIKKIHKTIIP